MKYAIALIVTLALVGCDTTPKVPKEVQVPIEVVCTTPTPPKPDYKFDKLSADDSLWDKTKALLSDRQLSIAYELELLTALLSCK